ncbi:M14 family metallopeptidase [Pontibacter harenae]|uniref:M14 family metallopeptidase n=1 Tax=Pontibacter harenae TaxID=2894083 RepID=UPI001E3C1785|nr:M14 family metallopeptidase [Pontibacter harenae]MCC9168594.1 M14 family metallopeptidase [Pontibacter harenae]
MKILNVKFIKYLYLSSIGLLSLSCQAIKQTEKADSPPDNTALATIAFQQKQKQSFNFGKVLFSNQFAAARANAFRQENDSVFSVLVAPENSPINPSPWYAFKVWSAGEQPIYIKLKYEGTKHRYNPQISSNGQTWSYVGNVQLNAQESEAFFKLPVTQDTLLVAAQEIISAASSYQWMDSLSQMPFLRKQIIGQSILGKPIVALHSTGSSGKKLVVVLSRQHPPEVTGYMAMQSFVQATTSATPLAKRFRKAYELVVIPMINPDGVDEGNWRHSAAGVDLNRDWDVFKQPETSAVKLFLLKKLATQKAKVVFALDFHSTYSDVFYTNETSQPTNSPGFTKKWLNAFGKAIPGFEANIKPSDNGGNVSKSWFSRELGADALTYEVGDDTPRRVLKMKGRIAAETMMTLLLQEEQN